MGSYDYELKRNTRVLFYLKDREEYLLTNEDGEISARLRLFSADKNGNITMKGYLLGSILNHDPEIIEEMEQINCTYEELNPGYFEKMVE